MLSKLKQQWVAEESRVGKLLKFFVGYLFTVSGVIADLTSNYIPLVARYVSDKLIHTIVQIGIIGYTLGKLTKRNGGQESH